MMRRVITILIFVLLSTIVAQGQETSTTGVSIKIGGNVYGGGNKGKVDGNTRVTVKAGDIGHTDKPDEDRPLANPRGRVFGGARMADIGGNAFVNIDGENATGYMVINHVYGGNDVAGHIGTIPANKKMPSELEEVIPEPTDEQLTEASLTREQWRAAQKAANPKKNNVDKTWDSYVRISTGTEKTYIGQLFGGGNGEFEYTDKNGTPFQDEDGNYLVKEGNTVIARSQTPFNKPELGKAYLEVVGGSIVYAYGGGNNATVTDETVIYVDNPSTVVNHVYVKADGTEDKTATEASHENATDLLSNKRFLEMGINTTFSSPSSDEFQIGRFFGGNNKAEMDIRPTWNLQGGLIRNLYSGGNQGDMTCSEGLLLEINPESTNTNPLVIDYVYGGCRMANVRPMLDGQITTVANLSGYFFPAGLSARTLVRGGDINNVFGGNDVTGRVYGGNAVGIYTSIRGDVYGGGNGAYPYTDNWNLRNNTTYGDLYYGDRKGESSGIADAFASLEALNAYRPNAEQVSIRLAGTEAKPTIIGGSVYCGGNCATLVPAKEKPMVELKIGSYAIADRVFLGNNGEGMVDKDILKHYKYYVDDDGDVVTSDVGTYDFSQIDLAADDTHNGKKPFEIYMDGAAMSLMPNVVFDQEKANGTGDPATYIGYTSQIGSFFCGGNVGSMTYPNKIDITFDRELIVYDKVVGGSNNANVSVIMDGETPLNTAYNGGVLGTTTDGNKLELTFNGLKIEPKRLYQALPNLTNLIKGNTYYTYDTFMRVYNPFKATGSEPVAGSQNTDGSYNDYYELGKELEWNTVKWDTNRNIFMQTDQGSTENPEDDNIRRLQGGNIYGGCFYSGHIDGNVVINIEADLMEKDKLFAESTEDDKGKYSITGDRRTGVILGEQSEDLQSVAMSVFGAGYGQDSEIWGSTTVNLKKEAYVFQIFGGGEKGIVGKSAPSGTYTLEHEHHENGETSNVARHYSYDPKYSTTINLMGSTEGSENAETATTQYIYGGGNEGLICGDVTVNLGNGRVDDDVFGGSCNADILGHVEVYIGGYGDWKTVGTGASATKTLEIKVKGFPWIGENVYTGNDFGGSIIGKGNYTSLLSAERMSMVYDGDNSSETDKTAFREDLLNSNTFATFFQGRVQDLYGGNYGSYDYTDNKYRGLMGDHFKYPHFDNSFIYFKPFNTQGNEIQTIFGGCQGTAGIIENNYTMQERSYVLIDDTNTDNPDRYAATDVYGGGAFAGLGAQNNIGGGRSAIDLFTGRVNNVYGGCNREGMIGYSRVNVPSGSTIQVNALYGGGKGYEYVDEEHHEEDADPSHYCDTYATCINYQSADAAVENGIYGGNRNMRIAADTYINIGTAVKNREGLLGTVYGAGYGDRTVSGRTNIFLNDGAQVKEVYGGGRDGNVFNFPSLTAWLGEKFKEASTPISEIPEKVAAYGTRLRAFNTYIDTHPINLPSNIGTYVNDLVPATNTNPDYYNTNVHILTGAEVKGNPKATGGTDGGYAYAGGLGVDAVVGGTTYIELKGGTVEKDIYAGGTSGPVYDEFRLGTFTAGTYANIESGTCRNVYGGGWRGDVGYAQYVDGSKVLYEEKDDNGNVLKTHYEQRPDFGDDCANDILGESHVTIGKLDGDDFMNGIPAIRRNVYGGGEGGAIYGTAHVTINKGYIGYHAVNTSTSDVPKYEFEEELDDYLEGDNKMKKHGGNVFGGGYVANSYVDNTDVKMYNGTIRGGLFGGGEIGPIGRGTVKAEPPTPNSGSVVVNHDARIYKAGKTHVEMYGGQVMRNVFGGGRGYDNWETYGWMSDVEKETMDLSSKGYVFGNTEVFIHGGKVGTKDAASFEDGNVFGGGDEGFVYSATGTKSSTDGYYYGSDSKLTEDCKVIISPYCLKKDKLDEYVTTEDLNYLANGNDDWNNLDQTGIDITNAVFAGGNISAGSDKIFVNTTTVFGNATASVTDVFAKDLITIGEDGIGGLYGDGNLTFVDGYRELNISNYGTDYYNLSQTLTLAEYQQLSDRERAYFELLYKPKQERTLEYYESRGTHVYHKDEHTDVSYKRGQKLPKDSPEYSAFSTEEKANWSSLHKKTYGINEKITQDDYNLLWAAEQPYWDLYGFCTLYAGRMINTIQRADFCGVFGSRVVMRGAQDRVPKTVDYTEYTINRVGEVSLNKQYNPNYPKDPDNSQISDENFNTYGHGNYFGIYNVVNYLGALTSDVYFTDIRKTANSDYQTTFELDDNTYEYGKTGATYENWKKANLGNRKRNNGSSPNEVALASGVWLELVDESTESKPNKEKVYGPITGIVELTLINVSPGEGGGYVYAKNLHGVRSSSGENQVTLAAANDGARSWKMYDYGTSNIDCKMQTSGNFVNSTKRIIDDCYPQNGAYYNREGGEKEAPAHYWFIRGDYYVYDQYISAYTGSSQAYAENVSIPLTITAESQGRLQLVQVQPNLYAYWSDINQIEQTYRSQSDPEAILVGGTTYKLNEPISYWAWSHLSTTEQSFFTEETWVCSNDATYNNIAYKKGDVYRQRPADIYVCKEAITAIGTDDQTITYPKGTVLTKDVYEALTETAKNDCAAVFNVSNAVNHDNGFLLTFDWDNPDVWNDYYHHQTEDNTVHASEYNEIPANYITSPSFKFNTTGSSAKVLGQKSYAVGDVIDATTYLYEINNIAAPDQNGVMVSKKDLQDHDLLEDASTQALFDQVYIAVTDHNFTAGGVEYVPNACISATVFSKLSPADQANFKAGKLCTTTYEYTIADNSHYIVAGTVIPVSTYDDLGSDKDKFFSDGYICKQAGLWGGTVFNSGQHYPAINFSNLSKDERGNFVYNYDALDLLVDPNYDNDMSMYDKPNADPIYSKKQSIDYEATYTGASNLDLGEGKTIDVKYYDSVSKEFKNATRTRYVENGDILTNTQYEALVNEAINYTPIVVDPKHEPDTTYYVVREGFQIGDKWYSEGNQMTYAVYDGLSSTDKAKVDPVTFFSLTGSTGNVSNIQRYYYCTNSYPAITAVTDIKGITHAANSTVTVGTIIPGIDNNNEYNKLVNQQRYFSINGKTPTETSTLYVARDIDINDLSQDRIITVVYHYDYLESDDTGNAYEKIREYHVVNVHVHFKSGVPTIGELLPPNTVLPGNEVNLNQPTVTKGAYELLGGGWEIFKNPGDAESHKNGVPFTSSATPLYWYQDGYYVAYYALSYLGKTYSNAVPLSVANYHRMNEVLDINDGNVTTENNYMYLNEAVKTGKRDPKVYIKNESELKKFAKFFDETLTKPELSNIEKCKNIDFIIDGDIVHTGEWTPIGIEDNPNTPADESKCFDGTLHGDGHTISGLNNSLFKDLCGSVYNLGVTGSFTGAGVVDKGTGYVESSWINTTGTPTGSVYAVFGNPSDTDHPSAKQVVNCYYQDGKNYKTDANTHGNATAKSQNAFYNGEVAYDLNNFYLYKRYSDHETTSGGVEYKYLTKTATGLSEPITGHYGSDPANCSSGYIDSEDNGLKYVEDRYLDGDFRYAGDGSGIIPTVDDARRVVVNEVTGEAEYYPIWPDDYIFFGQKLTYGYSTAHSHQSLPSVIVKDGRLLPNPTESELSNRVYRAPAYYRNMNMGVAHFNPWAYLVAKSKDGQNAYPNMTAIDFAGHNDTHDESTKVAKDYEKGLTTAGKFYPPLLDDDGLQSIVSDETQNLLVYAPAATGESGYTNASTHAALSKYFNDPSYNDFNESSDNYNDGHDYGRVASAADAIKSIHGHLVQSDLTADTDHLLVDKQDFNAPFAYTFESSKRMWYQRKPEKYVEPNWDESIRSTKGWEGVSLPFPAEVVTTDQKGEITHFYGNSTTGHEYWLREFSGIEDGSAANTVQANMNKLAVGSTSKSVYNTFLWDYYYQGVSHGHEDKNQDEYQTYYKERERMYAGYPRQQAATPYIIGFPSKQYYEFDLSGNFQATTTKADNPVKLEQQIITFASRLGETIHVSDKETGGVEQSDSQKKYIFKPSYLNEELEDGNYVMNSDGNAYRKLDNAPVAWNTTGATYTEADFNTAGQLYIDEDGITPADSWTQGTTYYKQISVKTTRNDLNKVTKSLYAFRPYFTVAAVSQSPSPSPKMEPEYIVFGESTNSMEGELISTLTGDIDIFVRGHKIIAVSHRKDAVPVRIVNVAGVVVADFILPALDTVITPVSMEGVYIANKRKLLVK